MSPIEPQASFRNSLIETLESFTIIDEPSDRIASPSSDSEDELWSITATDDNSHPTTSSYSTLSPINDPNSKAMKLAMVERGLREAREQKQFRDSLIEVQERQIDELRSAIDKERAVSASLATKLFDLFILMTQNQQHEIDKVQMWLLELQVDAENFLLGHEWRDLQEKLHNINRNLDEYMKLNTRQSIVAGAHKGELTLFLGGLIRDLAKMRKGLERLDQDIIAEKVRDVVSSPQDCEPAPRPGTDEDTNRKDVDHADVSGYASLTDITDRYYEFSRLYRKRTEGRKEKLQALFNLILTELGQLQGDIAFEEERTTNMKTRMQLWRDDRGVSKDKSLDRLIENLKIKLAALQYESRELEQIADIIQKMPSHVIDIRSGRKDQASTGPGAPVKDIDKAEGTQDYARVAGQREDTLDIAELEAN
ncbi:hypothetical protein F5B18DRAFT_636329 [Nemania serpens]|nr:hypothetical protein F5B18DRAFT_636329 [Nemania serpens]